MHMPTNKSSQEVGREYVAQLRRWFEANKDLSSYTWPDGTLNKGGIATAAGVPRGVLQANEQAQALLAEFGTPHRRDLRPATSVEDRETLRRKDAEISRLLGVVADRELELSKLRRKAAEADQLRAIHDAMIETMRHVKASPGIT